MPHSKLGVEAKKASNSRGHEKWKSEVAAGVKKNRRGRPSFEAGLEQLPKWGQDLIRLMGNTNHSVVLDGDLAAFSGYLFINGGSVQSHIQMI